MSGAAHEGHEHEPRPLRQEQEPADDDATEVAPGVLRIQLPVGFAGLGHVNCYALEDERGFALVDPGLPGPEPWGELTRRLTRAGIPLERVHTTVVTHSHPDHFGGATIVRAETGADLVASSTFLTWWDPDAADQDPGEAATDANKAASEHASADADEDADEDAGPRIPFGRPTPWGGHTHVPPPEAQERMGILGPEAKRWFRTPRPSVRIDDAQTVRLARREWVAMITPGHTPDHLCLYDPETNTLLSGDHVLPTITPHISGVSHLDDPLAAFLDSLERVAQMPDVRTVLPAHGHPFADLADRAREIAEHHRERLVRLTEICDELGPSDVVTLSHHLFAERAWGSMAESETYAHLEHLRLTGRATRAETPEGLSYAVS